MDIAWKDTCAPTPEMEKAFAAGLSAGHGIGYLQGQVWLLRDLQRQKLFKGDAMENVEAIELQTLQLQRAKYDPAKKLLTIVYPWLDGDPDTASAVVVLQVRMTGHFVARTKEEG